VSSYLIGICTGSKQAISVIGSLKSDDSWCRIACQELGIIIVNVDYRLAPEYPFPAQIWDAWDALKWVFSYSAKLGVDTSRVSVGGLSAGGHLAAVVALLARDEPSMPPLKLQLLVVPAVDARYTPIEGDYPADDPYASHHRYAEAPCLPLNRMRWFGNLWLGTDPEARKKSAGSWLASPILAGSHAGLAPASLHCAEFDVLKDEGQAYHEMLQKAGVESQIKIYEGVAHPFGHWDGELEKAKEYVRDTIAVLRRAHAPT
jgi:acetyl esterase/lipase